MALNWDELSPTPPGALTWDSLSATPPKQEDMGGFGASVKQAIGATIKGAGQAAGDFIPGVDDDNALKRYGQEIIDANPTMVQNLSDIAGMPWSAVKEAAGNAVGFMGGMVATRAAGQGITALAPLAGPAAPAVAAIGQAVAWLGPVAIASLPSFGGIRDKQILNDPENQESAKAKAVAALGAAAVGAIETRFGPQNWALAAMTKEGRGKLAEMFASKTLAGTIGKAAGTGALVEGAEELVQNPIEQVASGDNPLAPESLAETAFGGAMGAIGGGILGASMGAVSRAMPERQAEQAPFIPQNIPTPIETAGRIMSTTTLNAAIDETATAALGPAPRFERMLDESAAGGLIDSAIRQQQFDQAQGPVEAQKAREERRILLESRNQQADKAITAVETPPLREPFSAPQTEATPNTALADELKRARELYTLRRMEALGIKGTDEQVPGIAPETGTIAPNADIPILGETVPNQGIPADAEISPKTVGGIPVGAQSTEQLRAVEQDPNANPNSRRAAREALRTRAKSPETPQEALGQAQVAPPAEGIAAAPPAQGAQPLQEPAVLPEPVAEKATPEALPVYRDIKTARKAANKMEKAGAGKHKLIQHPTNKRAFAVVPVEANPPSEKQIKAREALSARMKAQATVRRTPNPAKDSLNEWIAKRGGLDISERLDTTGDERNQAYNGSQWLFRKEGEKVDELARRAAEAGYLSEVELNDVDGGVSALKAKIREEFGGLRRHYSESNQERDQGQGEEEQLQDAAAEHQIDYEGLSLDELRAKVRQADETKAAIAEANANSDARLAASQIREEYYLYEEDYANDADIPEGEQEAGIDAQEVEGSEPRAGETPDTGRQAVLAEGQEKPAGGDQAAREVTPEPLLKPYTNAEIAQREAAAKAAEEAGAKAEAAVNRGPRVTADQRDIFNDQGGLFDRPANQLSVSDALRLAALKMDEAAKPSEPATKPQEGAANRSGATITETKTPTDLLQNVAEYNAPAPWYYSALARGLESANMKAGPPAAWRDYIKGLVNKGVAKQDEVEWTGINDWLSAQEGRLTKEQVVAFMEQGGVKVMETVLGKPGVRPEVLPSDFTIRQDENGNWAVLDESGEIRGEGGTRGLAINDALNYMESEGGEGGTKFSDYQLPGSVPGSYRELVLTLPPKKMGAAESAEQLYENFIRKGGEPTWADLGEARQAEIIRTMPAQAENVSKDPTFESTHFPEAGNYLAHTRVNDRILPDGRKVLFVEEIQSDRAQKGRTEGFNNEKDRSALVAERAALGESQTDVARYNEITNELRRHEGAIPSAPFVTKTDSWTALVLKRLLRYAAEGDYAAIAWTRGDQQVERYTSALRKAVDVIEWKKTPEGVQIVGYKGNANDLRWELERNGEIIGIFHDEQAAIDMRNRYQPKATIRKAGRVKVVDTTEKESALSDAIGKSMADRIKNDPNQTGTIEGDGITVSDTGMAGYYDRIVPKVAQEVAKKVGGGKVGEIDLATKQEGGVFSRAEPKRVAARADGSGYDIVLADGERIGIWPTRFDAENALAGQRAMFERGPEPQLQQAIEITPAMREQIMSGQALFQRKSEYNDKQLELIYENHDLRPGTTQKQKDQGIHALRALLGGDRRAGATLLGSSIWADFQARLGSELLGQGVRSPQDLATLAQILRDPRFETLRFFFTKDGKVIEHTGVTSRMPGSVSFIGRIKSPAGNVVPIDESAAYAKLSNEAFDEKAAEIKAAMERAGADGYYVLHNHPGGLATPSSSDRNITQRFAKQIPGFKGHVVIDHDEYAVINRDGTNSMHSIKSPQTEAPEVAHDMLGQKIGGSLDLIAVAKNIQAKRGFSVLIGQGGADGRVTAIAEVPSALLNGKTKMEQMKALVRLRRFARFSGSSSVFVVSENPTSHDYLIENGAARDVVSTAGRSRRADGVEVKRESQYATGSVRAEQPTNQTDTPAFKRWFGDSKVVDADGKPLVVYHGTNRKFQVFEPVWKQLDRIMKPYEKTGGGSMQRYYESAKSEPDMYFFTEDEGIAEGYADQSGEPTVIQAYLKIENPAVDDVRDHGSRDRAIDAMIKNGNDGAAFWDTSVSGRYSHRAYAVRTSTQIKSAIGNRGTYDPNSPSIVEQAQAPYWINQQPADTQEALRKAGVWHTKPTLKARVAEWSKDWQKRLKQGVVDQFDPIKEYDYHAYMLARMARGADNALDGLLNYGTVYLDNDGAVDVNFERGGFLGIMSTLKGEHDRFLAWVIGNRAERLLAEGREHNFTPQDIAGLKALNQGQMTGGASRAQEYARVRTELDRYNKAVLDIAEKAGLIDAAGRVTWEKDFYVPFYRLMEDEAGKQRGPIPSKGLVNQYAFKVLKGGEQALGDPMENILKNWAHLLDASLKNQAARESLLAAQRVGVVVEGDEATVRQMAKAAGLKDAVVSFTDQGVQRWFMVEDAFLLDAMKAIGFTGFQGTGMKVMQKFKKWLTMGVTVSPTFRIRNVIRDSLQMIGANPASYNVLDNVLTGWKATKADSPEYASILAGGGVMRFGTILDGDRAEHVKRLIASGVDDQTILTTPERVKDALQQAWDWWQKVGDRAENVNRAALYKKLRADGKTHLEASFAARDTMDFSMQGTWAAIRFLSQTVPFFNARLQGLYKLGRGASEDPRRFGIVVGGAALASLALLMAYQDDDDWKKREDWDRETFWWFKIGDKAFRIPKPFEIGAIATIAERGAEAMMTDELTGKQFAQRVFSIVSQQLSMNPVPQLAMPMIELYANRDSFTDRPIEGMGMERMSKPRRIAPYTSATAQLLGKNGLISPVQIDHIVNGYFGWLGVHIVSTADLALRPAMGLPGKPAWRIDDVLVAGDFVKDMPAYQSKYVTRVYDQMKEVQQAMADLKELQKVGSTEEAKKLLEKKGDKIRMYRLFTNAEKQLADVNRKIKMVQYRSGDAESKRTRLDALYATKNRIAKTTEQRAKSLQQ